jgi:hypothetical protein
MMRFWTTETISAIPQLIDASLKLSPFHPCALPAQAGKGTADRSRLDPRDQTRRAFRILARPAGGRVRLYTRNGYDFADPQDLRQSERLPGLGSTRLIYRNTLGDNQVKRFNYESRGMQGPSA